MEQCYVIVVCTLACQSVSCSNMVCARSRLGPSLGAKGGNQSAWQRDSALLQGALAGANKSLAIAVGWCPHALTVMFSLKICVHALLVRMRVWLCVYLSVAHLVASTLGTCSRFCGMFTACLIQLDVD